MSVVRAGMNWASLVRRQTMTRMALNERVFLLVVSKDGGSSVIWSQDMDDHGRAGMGRGLSNPRGERLGSLECWQMSQD